MKNLKKGRKQEDLTKKYPVEEILESASKQSIRQLSKSFKLSNTVIHKIIHRYGAEELKKKFRLSNPQIIQKERIEATYSKDIHQQCDENNSFIGLLNPGLRVSEIYSRMKETEVKLQNELDFEVEKMEDLFENIKSVCKGDSVSMNHSLNAAALHVKSRHALYRLLLDIMKEEINVIEKFSKLESTFSELKTVKTLIDVFFNSFNLLDDKTYEMVKHYIIEVAPVTTRWFEEFESDITNYIQEIRKKYQAESGDNVKVS